jgi:zinc protease
VQKATLDDARKFHDQFYGANYSVFAVVGPVDAAAVQKAAGDLFGMLIASYMFGEPITSRISDRIRNREGLSYGANARLTIPAEGDAANTSGTGSLNPMSGPKVESSFVDELKKVYQSGFTPSELAEAKKAYLDQRMVGRATGVDCKGRGL